MAGVTLGWYQEEVLARVLQPTTASKVRAFKPVKQLGEGLGTAAGVLDFRGAGRAVVLLKTSYSRVSSLFIGWKRQEAQLEAGTPVSGAAAERVLLAPGGASYL